MFWILSHANVDCAYEYLCKFFFISAEFWKFFVRAVVVPFRESCAVLSLPFFINFEGRVPLRLPFTNTTFQPKMSQIRAQDTLMPVKMNSIALLSVEIRQFCNCSHLFLFAEVTCVHHVGQQHNHNTNEQRSAAQTRSWYSWRDFLLHLICDDRVWKLARDWRISRQ